MKTLAMQLSIRTCGHLRLQVHQVLSQVDLGLVCYAHFHIGGLVAQLKDGEL